MTLLSEGGNPTGREVLKLNKTLKTWEKVGSLNYYRHNHAASVVDSLEVLNICKNWETVSLGFYVKVEKWICQALALPQGKIVFCVTDKIVNVILQGYRLVNIYTIWEPRHCYFYVFSCMLTLCWDWIFCPELGI